MSAVKQQTEADDIVRIRQSTLIGLNREARKLPLKSGKIGAQFSGNYLSAFKGRGMEFDEVRPYQPGDDIRSMDWRVTARTGKPHTKLFREERERPVLLWVDYRQPMFFGTRNSFKSVVAAKAAALLAWSAAQHGDRLGGLIFSEHSHEELRPQRGKAGTLHFIKKLAEHAAWQDFKHSSPNESSGAQAMNRLRRVARPGSLIFLISDFRHLDEAAYSHLSMMARHNDVVLLSIHDPLETELPPAGFYRVSDGSNEMGLNTRRASVRENYQQRFVQHQQYLRDTCHKLNMFYLSLATDDNLVASLQAGLGLKK
ncbi:MAG: DUF58 domain-containing protein [Gammaproteobacteria bacterium]|nr:DUF58 domain-containing protein [Gammaproteobacteria bacterium]